MKGAVLLMHVSETLPDSLKARKALLQDACSVLSEDVPIRADFVKLLKTLEIHENEIARVQAELPLNLSTTQK
jgi:hypothetical protein